MKEYSDIIWDIIHFCEDNDEDDDNNKELSVPLLKTTKDLCNNGDAYIDEFYLYCICQRKYICSSIDEFDRNIESLSNKKLLYKDGRRIYLYRTWECENIAANKLARRLSNNSAAYVSPPDIICPSDIRLTDEQHSAVSMALSHDLSIVLGGAGTGKTKLIQSVILSCPNTRTILCAPTGKAAFTLTEKTGFPAVTVHSALMTLAYDYHSQQLGTDTVIIDEASMLTQEMFTAVLSLVRGDCRIVLVGDPNQLLSIGSGNVIPDLLELGVPYTHLRLCHRQSDTSSALSYNIQHFDDCRTVDDIRFDDSFVLIPETDEEMIRKMICKTFVTKYRAGESVQILSPCNSGSVLSVDQLNKDIQAMLQPKHLTKLPFYENDRVMILKNDWNKNVCNGFIGSFHILPEVNGKRAFSVDCGIQTPVWGGENASNILSLAYAVTVHKSQGSEYDSVIFPISIRFSAMLKRNLLYTAISRARKQVVLIGDKGVLNNALQSEHRKRRSALVEKTRQLQKKTA